MACGLHPETPWILICCQNIYSSITVADTKFHHHGCHPISNRVYQHLLTSVVEAEGGGRLQKDVIHPCIPSQKIQISVFQKLKDIRLVNKEPDYKAMPRRLVQAIHTTECQSGRCPFRCGQLEKHYKLFGIFTMLEEWVEVWDTEME